jgi:hypothetical protein
MPPKFPWKATVLCVLALVVIGIVLVTMWPGMRKPHAVRIETSQQSPR